MTFRRKNIRLAADRYVGKTWSFITVCCANRRKLLTTPKFCDWLLDIFQRQAVTHSIAIHAYCLMPDHFHLLLEGLHSTTDLLEFVKSVKTKSSAPYMRKNTTPLWQKKFYDHILRSNDSPDDVAWYIWKNPVRASLCRRPEEYPFLGSFTGMWPKTPEPYAPWFPPWKDDFV
jgi:putative transposase